jgi:hypothetical protein
MKRALRKQIKAATAKALEDIDSIFVAPPGPCPEGGCQSCGELRPIVEHTEMWCEECTEIAYQFYPDMRPRKKG